MSKIETQYQHAINSPDLSHDAHRITHVDVLTAFGMSRSTLGLALLRLHSEWDGSTVRLHRTNCKIDVIHLRSLSTVLRGIAEHAQRLQQRNLRRGRIDNREPMHLACLSLEYWINALCPTCRGAGELIVQQKIVTCPRCQGSRHRSTPSDPMIRALLQYIDDCQISARSTARKWLRN